MREWRGSRLSVCILLSLSQLVISRKKFLQIMCPPEYCFKHDFHHCWADGSWLMTVGKKSQEFLLQQCFFSVNKNSCFYSQMCSLHPGGEKSQKEKQDDSTAAIIMTCDVWLMIASVVCVCFSFDMLFSLRGSCVFCRRNI